MALPTGAEGNSTNLTWNSTLSLCVYALTSNSTPKPSRVGREQVRRESGRHQHQQRLQLLQVSDPQQPGVSGVVEDRNVCLVREDEKEMAALVRMMGPMSELQLRRDLPDTQDDTGLDPLLKAYKSSHLRQYGTPTLWHYATWLSNRAV